MHDIIEKLDFSLVDVFSTKLIDLLRQYYVVGGMPEVVDKFLKEHDFSEVRYIQNQLLAAYEQDLSKHAPAGIVPRIRSVWNSLPAQLARKTGNLFSGL